MLLSLLHAWLSITIKADQIISGTVINILALGGTAYFNQLLVSTSGLSGTSTLPRFTVPEQIAEIPLIGPIINGLFNQGPIAMSLIVFVIGLQILLFRSRWGLRTRAVGEHPKAADTVGIDVIRTRYRSVVLGGVFAGLAGAYLTLEQFNSFQDNMTGGVGFIGLAAMIFGRWTPLGAYGAALLFGTVQSMQLAVRISPPAGDLGEIIVDDPAADLRDAPVHLHDHRPGRRGRAGRPAGGGRHPVRQGGARLTADDEAAARAQAERRADRERTRAIVDLHEGRGPVPVLDDAGIRDAHRDRRAGSPSSGRPPTRGARRSGSCGRSSPAGSTACRSTRTWRSVHGVPAYPTLAEATAATGPFDIVDVFRRSDLCVPACPRGGRGGRALPVAPARASWTGRRPGSPTRRACRS